ncbi:IS21 family transposase, partial [Rhodococcus sp. T2V]|nr:IS21 family transposase [Rhodococcus sp. T2V]
AAFVGAATVDSALSRAAESGRFAEGDLPAIVAHHTATSAGAVVVADERHSVQPGTAAWAGFGSTSAEASS